MINVIFRGSRDALRRIAYEFCEDCAEHGIKYVETRYAPHLFANNSEKPIFAPDKGDLSPREVVSTICQALQKGSRDFNITAKSILCCMEHTPGKMFKIVKKDFQVLKLPSESCSKMQVQNFTGLGPRFCVEDKTL